MSENKHTPEPWRTAERSGFPFHIDDARGESVAMMLADDDHDEHRGIDNARRIVACVNACAGVDTECLEVAPIGIFASKYGSPGYIDQLEKQRDELLAALEKCRKELSAWMRVYGDDIATQEAVADARAAIASVKGYGQPEKSAKTEVPAIVFFPAGSLGEEIEEEGRPA